MYLMLSKHELDAHDARVKTSHPHIEMPNNSYNMMAEIHGGMGIVQSCRYVSMV